MNSPSTGAACLYGLRPGDPPTPFARRDAVVSLGDNYWFGICVVDERSIRLRAEIASSRPGSAGPVSEGRPAQIVVFPSSANRVRVAVTPVGSVHLDVAESEVRFYSHDNEETDSVAFEQLAVEFSTVTVSITAIVAGRGPRGITVAVENQVESSQLGPEKSASGIRITLLGMTVAGANDLIIQAIDATGVALSPQ